MTLSPAAQAHALALSLAAGAGLGLFYDLLRPLRLSPLSRWLAALTDLLFWLAAAGLLFACASSISAWSAPPFAACWTASSGWPPRRRSSWSAGENFFPGFCKKVGKSTSLFSLDGVK